jgi:uncharacterized membrane protein
MVSRRLLPWIPTHRWELLVCGAMLAWTAVLFVTVRDDYLHFGLLQRWDLGNMVQAVWNTAHGRPLESTFHVERSRLAYHVDPILVLLTPIWMIWPSPLALAAVQIVACALGALPLFWLGRRHLGSEKAAALITLAYLAYPWLAWTASDAMHPVTLAIPLFLYAIWFLDTQRFVRFGLCAALIATTGELMGLTIAALGIWYALARGQRLAGGVIALLGASWSIIAVKLIVPAFLGQQSIYYSQYDAVGGSPAGIVRTLFTHPATVGSKLFSADDLVEWFWLSVPLVGLFLLAPWLALVALPEVLVNGLSDLRVQTDPRQHYIAGVIPFLLAASVLGLARLSPKMRVRGAAAVLCVSIALLVIRGPFPGTPLRDSYWQLNHPNAAHVEALRSAIALVPGDASVTATGFLHPNLSARRYTYTLPFVGPSEWVVLDTRPVVIEERGDAIRKRLETDRRWIRVFSRDGVFVFRRVSGA